MLHIGTAGALYKKKRLGRAHKTFRHRASGLGELESLPGEQVSEVTLEYGKVNVERPHAVRLVGAVVVANVKHSVLSFPRAAESVSFFPPAKPETQGPRRKRTLLHSGNASQR